MEKAFNPHNRVVGNPINQRAEIILFFFLLFGWFKCLGK